jgi:hypothetical protein
MHGTASRRADTGRWNLAYSLFSNFSISILFCYDTGFGGVMALTVWARNRNTRHRRHVHLLEDLSLAAPPSAPREAVTP